MSRSKPKSKPKDRDALGKFQPGNRLGFAPGKSGNPDGPPGGAKPGHYMRTMHAMTGRELAAIAGDEDQPQARRAAARALLDMTDADPQVRGRALDRVLDRTEGRPHQTATVEHRRQPEPAEVLARIRARLGAGEAN